VIYPVSAVTEIDGKRVNYLCTCIAINLMLIICFGVNPNKWSKLSIYHRKYRMGLTG
jgi:hypothetical protein